MCGAGPITGRSQSMAHFTAYQGLSQKSRIHCISRGLGTIGNQDYPTPKPRLTPNLQRRHRLSPNYTHLNLNQPTPLCLSVATSHSHSLYLMPLLEMYLSCRRRLTPPPTDSSPSAIQTMISPSPPLQAPTRAWTTFPTTSTPS